MLASEIWRFRILVMMRSIESGDGSEWSGEGRKKSFE